MMAKMMKKIRSHLPFSTGGTPVSRLPRLGCLLATFATAVAAVIVPLFAPIVAWAASSSDDVPQPDARLEGYPSNVALGDGGTAMTIVFLIVLAAITVGVLFINAKRSHLD